ncbi:MAG: helix-turn-helix domain-containing protein [Patescibacteria group bacterium]
MVDFSQRNIDYKDSVGCLLFDARQKNCLDLEVVAEKINISVSYLKALENNKYSDLPGKVYAINFLKKYADFLGFNGSEMMSKFEQESDIFYNTSLSKKSKSLSDKFEITPKKIKLFTILIIILAVVTYLIFLIYQTLSSPELIINYPSQEMILIDPNVTFYGTTDVGAEVKINGSEVFVNDDGKFEHQIYLVPGLNEISVAAKKKHSPENLIIHKIMYLKN